MISLQDIRKTFLDFFQKNDHFLAPSSSLVPCNDPSLLFTNSGMVQFKDFFTGKEKPKFLRAATSQKCLRAGGKHNDLDNVGYTSRHHTFFEMLGNFSFGDYFKEEAIYYAWTLVRDVFCLDKNRLYVTVYDQDEEAFLLWQKHLPKERIIKISTMDNFWMMGDLGPCGPCSEIFYDHGDHIFGGLPGTKDQDGDRFVEIWNLVFMQFEQNLDGSKTLLPKPSIDTGMGLERMAAVLQGVSDNYETDLFQKLIQNSISFSQKEPYQSHRIIADHLRASCFMIADGILPTAEGRGYVLRRIMRRSMRQAYKLGAKEALMWKLVPFFIDQMGRDYPELIQNKALIEDVLRSEEERFGLTLERGLKLVYDETKMLKSGDCLPGDIAFKLYDTYGFPLDLTQDVLREKNFALDLEGFEMCMKEQKTKAKWTGAGLQEYNFDTNNMSETHFLGYDLLETITNISALFDIDGKPVNHLDCEGFLLVPQTSFYAESGGQKGDRGILKSNQCDGEIINTVKKNKSTLHHVRIKNGILNINDDVELFVNPEIRTSIARHHSATHLLHLALKTVLGEHVAQKGSLVEEHKLRFDFSHFSALTQEQIESVEDIVNASILKNEEVLISIKKYDEAIQSGAIGLFAEKYEDDVRVVQIGKTSKELCGGTHVKRSGDIGLFQIIYEGSVSSGVRRIEAVSGTALINYFRNQKKEWFAEKSRLLANKKNQNKQTGIASPLESLFIKGINVCVARLKDEESKSLKNFADQQKEKIDKGIILIINEEENKFSYVVCVKNLEISAVDIVKQLSHLSNGKGGGGRADMAQGGGLTKIKNIESVLQNILSQA
jgi:alanyl-tRNA synthetase